MPLVISTFIIVIVLFTGCSFSDYGYIQESGIWKFRSSTGNGVYVTDLDNANSKTFEVLSNEYAKNKDFVFYKGEKLPEADPATFAILSPMHSFDKNSVYCERFRLPQSDPSTFKVLPDSYYRIDKNNVYWGCQIVKGADPASFRKQGAYWRDKNNLYKLDKPIDWVDVASLIEYTDSVWAHDHKRAYVDGTGITPDDISSFHVIKGAYARDNHSFYAAKSGLYPRKIDIRDRESFIVIDKFWAKDKKAVYWTGIELTGANPNTFTIISDHAGQDGETCYLFGKRLDRKCGVMKKTSC